MLVRLRAKNDECEKLRGLLLQAKTDECEALRCLLQQTTKALILQQPVGPMLSFKPLSPPTAKAIPLLMTEKETSGAAAPAPTTAAAVFGLGSVRPPIATKRWKWRYELQPKLTHTSNERLVRWANIPNRVYRLCSEISALGERRFKRV